MLYRAKPWLLVMLSLFATVCHGDVEEQWPSFRGPLCSGVAPTAHPPTTWSPTKNLKWKTPIPGKASSSPIVWDDKVFLTTAIPQGGKVTVKATSEGRSRRRRKRLVPSEHEFVVLCLARSTGEVLWQEVAEVGTPSEAAHADNTFASASPCTDGECLIVSFGTQGLFCYDLDGKLRWKSAAFGPMTTRGSFGEGSSPTIYRDFVILPWDHEGDSYLAAFDKNTGAQRWRIERDEPTNWATPIVVEQETGPQIVHSGQSFTRGYDLATGEELWKYSGLTQRPVSTPVSRDGIAFFASSRGGAFMGAVNLSGRGSLNGTASEMWTVTKGTPDIPSLLLVGNRLYFLAANSGVLSCVDATTGELIGAAKRLGNMRAVYSSPVSAAGHVYVTGRDGKTVVLKADDSLETVAENDLGEPVDATPAIVGEDLFLRGASHLFCFSQAEAVAE
jgi:outer membrane protein assembly factor BamB